MAVDGQRQVYFSDSGVLIYDAGGRHLGSLGGEEVVFGAAFNDRGEMFAAFRNRHTVIKFAPGKWWGRSRHFDVDNLSSVHYF